MKTLLAFFDSGPSFLDPRLSKDGTPYGPKRFKELVRECWYISDNLHTSYTDVLDMSFFERFYLIECINEKIKEQEKELNKKLAEINKKKRG